MSNYKFKLAIDAADIYNKLLPEQKELFQNVKITNVELLQDKYVYIECLALTNEIIERNCCQRLLTSNYISAF